MATKSVLNFTVHYDPINLFCDITIKKNVNSILFVSPKEIIVPDIAFNC